MLSKGTKRVMFGKVVINRTSRKPFFFRRSDRKSANRSAGNRELPDWKQSVALNLRPQAPNPFLFYVLLRIMEVYSSSQLVVF